jgi:uroporphyrin-3 C-methyltransferase
MNELPTSSDASPSSQSDQSAPHTEAAAARSAQENQVSTRSRKRNWLIYGLFVVLAVLLGLHWWVSQREIRELRADVAQRVRAGEVTSTETRVMMSTVQDTMKELQAKVNILEGKQIDAQSQQVALEQLYQDLSRNRDDWALAEVEQVLSIANQQLQLSGNVQGAIIALQNADARLSVLDRPQFLAIRRAIASDIEKLKALPEVDLVGIAQRLDSVIDLVDSMPLLSDEKPALPATEPKTSRRATKADEAASASTGWGGDWLNNLENAWQSWANEMWAEIRQLIRVRDVDASEALLLSPTQAYYVRENLKLRLLNARLALVTRNESVFRRDLAAAQDAISKFFDTRAKQTQTAQTLLRQVQASDLAIEMPTLAVSLNAVRNYKVQP